MADSAPPTNFIPHDTAIRPPMLSRSRGALNDLLILSAVVLFVASVGLAVAVFLYQQFLQTESASKLAQLQRAQAAFEPSLIQQFTRLDDRMHSADQILSAHIALTAFFHALEQSTLQTVSFQTLSIDTQDPEHINISMTGTAQSVNSIALQADLFSKNGVITSPIFSNIARQNDGVHFNLAAMINLSGINYSSLIQAQNGGGSAAQPSQGTSPFGSTGSTQPSQSVPTASSTSQSKPSK